MPPNPVERAERVRQLLHAGRAGDQAALGELLELFRGYLLLIAGQEISDELRPKIGASDIVQNTVLEAYRLFAQFEGEQPDEVRAWLRQVLVFKFSEARNHYATQKRQLGREQSLDDSAVGAPLHQALAGADSTPSARAIRHEEATALTAALARLSEEHRLVITWRNWDRLPFAAIGARLDRSEEVARKLYGRAMVRLQAKMGNDHADGPEQPNQSS